MPRIPKPTIGGSAFTHNAVEFDYCISEAIASLCAFCDEVVVLDAQSTDTTVDVLNECAQRHNNLRVITGANWQCASNYDRLAILANEAKAYLKTDWHFMLQADEVVHEASIPQIRRAVTVPGKRAQMVRRINLFGDMNHYLGFDLPQDKKPCSDIVLRLATTDHCACGDAESLAADPVHVDNDFVDKINIFHYGMVRRDLNFIEKIISMQSWFFGEGSQPDQRAVDLKNEGAKHFDWKRFKERGDLRRLEIEHPIYSRQWAEERQREKIPVED